MAMSNALPKPKRVGEELPRVQNTKRSKWAQVLEPLKKDPKMWYIIAVFDDPRRAYSLTSFLKNREIMEGDWEFSSRSENGVANVYARFVKS
jgi:hypothetical protein